MSFAAYLNAHCALVNRCCWLLCISPAIYLLHKYHSQDMGINPFEYLLNFTGHTAMLIFIVTYAIVPLRRWILAYCSWRKLPYGKRLSDWNFLLANRRMLGLNVFYYASLHLLLYIDLELDYDGLSLIEDLPRVFIAIAWLSWGILLLLALTSPKMMQKKLKRNWQKLHLCIHPLALLLWLHLYFEASTIDIYLLIYGGILITLIFHRIVVSSYPAFVNKRDTGQKVHR
jgi:sulfoxide reductase heme-binding subunit YedZ